LNVDVDVDLDSRSSLDSDEISVFPATRQLDPVVNLYRAVGSAGGFGHLDRIWAGES
jgi:hypothetical protein